MIPPQPPKETYPFTFVQGVVIGLALGAGMTLWYAPRTARQTLSQVKQQLAGLQGESIEQSLQQGRQLAHQYRAQQAKDG